MWPQTAQHLSNLTRLCSESYAQSMHLIRKTAAICGPCLFSIGINSGRPCRSETAAIVVEPQSNSQPIMTGEMEPSTLNVTLSLRGIAQCFACWRTCLEPRQMERGRQKQGNWTLRIKKISKQMCMCYIYWCEHVKTTSICRISLCL